MPSWYRRNPDGTVSLFVHAQPGAKRTEICGVHGEALKVRVAAPALEDRANEALVEFIADRLGIPRRAVAIASGKRSRDKRLEIRAAGIAVESLLSP